MDKNTSGAPVPNSSNGQSFNSATHGKVNVDEIISIIKDFLEEEPEFEYSLVIGTDSHEKKVADGPLPQNGTRTINLVTAVLIHRKGFGGKYFWIRHELPNIHNLREKIYAETLASLDFAISFVPLLKKSLNGKVLHYNLEIHVDVGEHGDTRDMIKEVVGMVTGNGFVAKTKPQAYAASYVADKHT
ncbi:MAG TPA: ribonuclease H-like YkuK family protein [Patescibacteria group bacterium]|nr:ribonuclease H-like YkuK family protein [Patescibacteria group bacterium]